METSGVRMRKDVIMLAAGVCMLPWMFVLWTSLPEVYAAQHWRLAWVGFDTLEALGLLASAWLFRRGDVRAPFAAIGTATLLVVDAWFDITTAGDDVVMSLLLASVELPLAAVCVTAAWQRLPRRVPSYV